MSLSFQSDKGFFIILLPQSDKGFCIIHFSNDLFILQSDKGIFIIHLSNLKMNPARGIPHPRTQKPSVLFIRFLRFELKGTQRGVSHSPEKCCHQLLRITHFLYTPNLNNLMFFLRFLRFERDPAKIIPHTRSQKLIFSEISKIWKGPSEEHSTHQISKTYCLFKWNVWDSWDLKRTQRRAFHTPEFKNNKLSSLGSLANIRNLRNLKKKNTMFWDLVCGMLFAGSLSNLKHLNKY